ncbi:hypothetical protein [Pseudomonas lactis]|uniref:hypothetical protein n=1 Tax=Pseudomonas lactis TaxID=1615674 RepID=UPI00110CE441|nr:hypothetical protein [Pseudomonas lactis]
MADDSTAISLEKQPENCHFAQIMQVLRLFLTADISSQSPVNRGFQPEDGSNAKRLISKQCLGGAPKPNISTMIALCAQLA